MVDLLLCSVPCAAGHAHRHHPTSLQRARLRPALERHLGQRRMCRLPARCDAVLLMDLHKRLLAVLAEHWHNAMEGQNVRMMGH